MSEIKKNRSTLTPTPSVLQSFETFANPKEKVNKAMVEQLSREKERLEILQHDRHERLLQMEKLKEIRKMNIQNITSKNKLKSNLQVTTNHYSAHLPSIASISTPKSSSSITKNPKPVLTINTQVSNQNTNQSTNIKPSILKPSCNSNSDTDDTKSETSNHTQTSHPIRIKRPGFINSTTTQPDNINNRPIPPVTNIPPRPPISQPQYKQEQTYQKPEINEKLREHHLKEQSLELRAAKQQTALYITGVYGGIETLADIIQFRAVKTKGLRDNMEKGVLNGNFDTTIESVVNDPQYREMLKDPVKNFLTTSVDIVLKTHQENDAREREEALKLKPKTKTDNSEQKAEKKEENKEKSVKKNRDRRRELTPSSSDSSDSDEDEEEELRRNHKRKTKKSIKKKIKKDYQKKRYEMSMKEYEQKVKDDYFLQHSFQEEYPMKNSNLKHTSSTSSISNSSISSTSISSTSSFPSSTSSSSTSYTSGVSTFSTLSTTGSSTSTSCSSTSSSCSSTSSSSSSSALSTKKPVEPEIVNDEKKMNNNGKKPRFNRPEFATTLQQPDLPDFSQSIDKMTPVFEAMNTAIEIGSQNEKQRRELNNTRPKLFD